MCITQLSGRQLLHCLQTEQKCMRADTFCLADVLASSFVQLSRGFPLIAGWSQALASHGSKNKATNPTPKPLSELGADNVTDLGSRMYLGGDINSSVWPASRGVQHPAAKSCSGSPGWQPCQRYRSPSEWVWQHSYELLTQTVVARWVINDLLRLHLFVLAWKQHFVPVGHSCHERHVVEQDGSTGCLNFHGSKRNLSLSSTSEEQVRISRQQVERWKTAVQESWPWCSPED